MGKIDETQSARRGVHLDRHEYAHMITIIRMAGKYTILDAV